MNKIIFSVCLLSCIGCTPEVEYSSVNNYNLRVTAVFTESGLDTLYEDANAFYHLTLDTTRNQTIRRITGFIKVNGVTPFSPEKVIWESNLYWWLIRGDTVANVVKTYFNPYTAELTTVILPPLIAQRDELVPTINCCSYSGTGGEINTMIAPIKNMKGDTLIVRAYNWTSNKTAIAKIVLE
jgi:hypothetical protein